MREGGEGKDAKRGRDTAGTERSAISFLFSRLPFKSKNP